MSILTKSFVALIAIAVAMQLVPYGKNHVNPPVVREPVWDSPATRNLVKQACFDCHSNETVWPWYSRIAPFSWLVYHDVAEAREELNFSDWQGGTGKAEKPQKVAKEVQSGDMPPFQYKIAHPEARLDDATRKALLDGLTATMNAATKR
ncbi:heme-binding domain-containing protein [Geobacter sp. AOG2]|uniref:heme-binding domain-containing protein n=1 Tax=Geobacter sp. AOG2 TaxID=1566347 RepID=UPI001CC5728C|nr:heme-binding domain-containing protein [Geobacter sp. AOG2]GFE61491.1 cytochrome c [Geobacter sp. AOG2]